MISVTNMFFSSSSLLLDRSDSNKTVVSFEPKLNLIPTGGRIGRGTLVVNQRQYDIYMASLIKHAIVKLSSLNIYGLLEKSRAAGRPAHYG